MLDPLAGPLLEALDVRPLLSVGEPNRLNKSLSEPLLLLHVRVPKLGDPLPDELILVGPLLLVIPPGHVHALRDTLLVQKHLELHSQHVRLPLQLELRELRHNLFNPLVSLLLALPHVVNVPKVIRLILPDYRAHVDIPLLKSKPKLLRNLPSHGLPKQYKLHSGSGRFKR